MIRKAANKAKLQQQQQQTSLIYSFDYIKITINITLVTSTKITIPTKENLEPFSNKKILSHTHSLTHSHEVFPFFLVVMNFFSFLIKNLKTKKQNLQTTLNSTKQQLHSGTFWRKFKWCLWKVYWKEENSKPNGTNKFNILLTNLNILLF